MNTKTKGTLFLGLMLVAVLASAFVLSASAIDQTRDRVKDQTQDCDCTNDCICDGTPDQTRDRTQDQTQDCDCTNDCICDGTPDQQQDRIRDRDCKAIFVKDQIQLQLKQQIRDC